MSAPTPAPGDDRPREGYYPDPSIPGYVRYWNGTAWVPGTSRPAPSDGTAPAPPGGAGDTAPPGEETGPHFFDEDPPGASFGTSQPAVSRAEAQHGSRPEPASAWGADSSRQSGFGGEQDRRISWGAGDGSSAGGPSGNSAGSSAQGSAPGSDPRVPAETEAARADSEPSSAESTLGIRAISLRAARRAAAQAASSSAPQSGTSAPQSGTSAPQSGTSVPQQPSASAASAPSAASSAAASAMQQGAVAFRKHNDPSAVGGSAGTGLRPGLVGGVSAPENEISDAPMAPGAGGGQPSWAQQVHRLADRGEAGAVAPWKPVREDPFAAVARAQAAVRPAALGKRAAARLIDTLVLAVVTGAVAVPLVGRAVDHIDAKIDAAKRTGETVTVWLLDATTGTYLAIVLGVLLLFGVLYEALPTAKWGRTLGKRLCGLHVEDIRDHQSPTFGAALRRWLVYVVPGLLVVGVVGMLWCLVDKPWRQCWHDKAARTFVAG